MKPPLSDAVLEFMGCTICMPEKAYCTVLSPHPLKTCSARISTFKLRMCSAVVRIEDGEGMSEKRKQGISTKVDIKCVEHKICIHVSPQVLCII